MSKKNTLLLQPIQGKFVQVTINGKIVRVWLVDPDTNKQGTEIPYDDAISLLSLPHPVVCLAQVKGKDGKYLVQLDDEDKEVLEDRKREFKSGTMGTQDKPSVDVSAMSAMGKLLETQTLLIKNQQAQMEAMQKQMDKLDKQMSKMEKKA